METKLKTPAEAISATRKLVECAVMVALAIVLNFIKVAELPNGGSITAVSMLPIILISYRLGYRWGFSAAAVYAVVQQVLGLKNLTYVFGWYSVVAVILLDYMIAFTVLGLASVTKKKIGVQAVELCVATIIVCILRYLCHVLSGAVVWGELIEGGDLYVLAAPSGAALIYSIGYNALYMIPETILTAAAAFYVGSVIDFTAKNPKRVLRTDLSKKTGDKVFLFRAIGRFLTVAAIVFDTFEVFRVLEADDAGRFDFSTLSNFRILPAAIVTGGCFVLACAAFVLARKAAAKGQEEPAER